MTNYKRLFNISIYVLMIAFATYHILKSRKETHELKLNQAHFYSDNYAGIIETISYNRQYSLIKLKDNETTIILNYASNYDYSPSDLSEFLEIGDTILKPTNSYELNIFRKGRKYYFEIGNIRLNK